MAVTEPASHDASPAPTATDSAIDQPPETPLSVSGVVRTLP